MPLDIITIHVNCVSTKEAVSIADSLLNSHLVACANIIPEIRSSYWWKGRIERAKEVMLVMKTRRKNFKLVEKEVKRLHSYDVPEIIALPVVNASTDYIKWIKANTK
jgi:periplasmic divalent cation tolerance protein